MPEWRGGRRVVGVVKTAKHGEVTEEATRHVYVPLAALRHE